jgi:hypothetical protein
MTLAANFFSLDAAYELPGSATDDCGQVRISKWLRELTRCFFRPQIRNMSSIVVTDKITHPFRNPFSHLAALYQLALFGLSSRVFETLMDANPTTGKNRAGLSSVVANRNHVIKWLACKFVDGLRAISRDVDSDLSHCRYRIGVEAARTSACAEHIESIASEMT